MTVLSLPSRYKYGIIPVENAEVGSHHIIVKPVELSDRKSKSIVIDAECDTLSPGVLVRLDYHNPKTKEWRWSVAGDMMPCDGSYEDEDMAHAVRCRAGGRFAKQLKPYGVSTIPLLPETIDDYPYAIAESGILTAIMANPKMGYFDMGGIRTELTEFDDILKCVLNGRMRMAFGQTDEKIRSMSAPELQGYVGKYLKDDSIEFCQKICDNFESFTRKHIARVNAVASFIGKYYPEHDADKFRLPFYYLLQYQHSGNKLPAFVKDVKEVEKLIGRDTWEHIISNRHHPENWDTGLNLHTEFDRSKPKTGIDAREMPNDALDEYVCDCLAMAIMIHNDPKEVYTWFQGNISYKPDKRWRMTEMQIDYIHKVAMGIISKLQDKKRKVYFDVDGVLRDIVKYLGTTDNEWDVRVNGKSIMDIITADFSCLKKMPDTQFVPVVRAFTQEPNICSSQIEPLAQKYTTEWLQERFRNPQITYVGKGSYSEKEAVLNENDRIFDDHPKFPENNKLIVVGHGYNAQKKGFRVETPDEMEAVLEVLKQW